MVPVLVSVLTARKTAAVWHARPGSYVKSGSPSIPICCPGAHILLCGWNRFAGLPSLVFAGERFAIELAVTSPRATDASVELSAEGKPLGTSNVKLEAGSNLVRLHASIATAGAVQVAGVVTAPGLGDVRFAESLSLRKPRLLFISQDPAGVETHLLGALNAAQFEVTTVRDIPASPLDEFQVVAFNNWDLETNILLSRKEEFEKFVQQGGGLVVIGGEKNVYVENKKTEDALVLLAARQTGSATIA